MSETGATFGARYAALDSVGARAALEAGEGRRQDFAAVDAVLDRLISTAMRGERVATLIAPKTKKDIDRVELLIPLLDDERAAVAEHFEVANQEKRGSWYVPEGEVLSLGLMHTVHWVRSNPRLVINLADVERATPAFRGEPEASAVWVLEPLFEDLFLPLKLRGLTWLGKKTAEQQEKQWAVIDPLYAALGLDPEPLVAFRPGTGWSRHKTDDIVRMRQALVESWAAAPEDVGARYRAYRLGQVIDRYYAKAKKGQALRKGVLMKAAGRTLSAYFGGDWLAFLTYLGEEPHPGEEIIQALPTTKLMVGTTDRTAEVAAKHGLPAEEVERMLSAYWQQSDHSSPVEQRVSTIKRFWQVFDDIHARQEQGMPTLWGLVDEGGVDVVDDGPTRYQYGAHRRLLPDELNTEIERLWGTSMLPRWPDRIVSEPEAHAKLAAAIGPALSFWHGAALTAWFLCEGTFSRTDMDGLANYHHRELDALSELGCPVGGELFRELREAEKRLQPVEREFENSSEREVAPGVVLTVGMSTGPTKLMSFNELRDIITRRRREWSEQHFERYIRARWETDLRAAGDAYNRLAAQRGKAPTAKQFAKPAADATNLWFGGNLTGVYSVLGVKSPVSPTQRRLMPADPVPFAQRVFTTLGGEPRDETVMESEEEHLAQWERNSKHGNYYGLARDSLRYVQLEEALGWRPDLKEFGTSKFKHRSEVLSEDLDEAWRAYGDAIHQVLGGTGSPNPVDAEPREAAAAASSSEDPPSAGAADNTTTSAPTSAPAEPKAGWYADPWKKAQWRWWDGQQWTGHTG